jgi:hypothetical protein
LILPFGRAVKSDLQKIGLSAVSADGLYFSTDVPVIFLRKNERKPMCLGDFERHFGDLPHGELGGDDDETILNHIHQTIKAHNPNMTRSEELFIDLYFDLLTVLRLQTDDNYTKEWDRRAALAKQIGVDHFRLYMKAARRYKSSNDVWRALLPIPELQLYVQDPLAAVQSYEPNNNFRVDYGFWDGEKLTAIEIDGAEPAGYARDIRRDRLLRRAGVDVIHILNIELERHKARALDQLLPDKFFGVGWDFEGKRPDYIPF